MAVDVAVWKRRKETVLASFCLASDRAVLLYVEEHQGSLEWRSIFVLPRCFG